MDTKVTKAPCAKFLDDDGISEKSKFILETTAPGSVSIKFENGNGIVPLNEESTEKTDKKPRGFAGLCGRYSGIVFMLIAAAIVPLDGVFYQKFMKQFHPYTVSVYRLQGILLPSIPLLLYSTKCGTKKEVFSPIWPLSEKSNFINFMLLLLRAVLGCATLVLHYYCLRYLTIADAMIIGSIKPVLATVVAHFVLGEKSGFFTIFVAVLTILGVGIILRPPILTGNESFDIDLLIGASYAFGVCLTVTVLIVIMRHLRKIHVSILHFSLGTSGTIFMLILSLSFGVFIFPLGNDLLYALVQATLAFVIQTLTLFAVKKETAGIVSLVRRSEIVFAIFWQFVLLDVLPDIFSIIGASIVMLGVILTTWAKWISTLPEDHPKKKRYSFVLK